MKFPKKILESISDKLEREKKLASDRLDSMALEDPFANPDRLTDNASIDTEAKEEAGHDRVEAIRRAIRYQVSRIERALKRLKKGGYGICERCGKPIEAKRLEVLPTATLCVTCERAREK